MVSWDGKCHLLSNSSPPLCPTSKSSRMGSFLLGRATKITMWVFCVVSFSCCEIVYMNLYNQRIHITYCKFLLHMYASFLPRRIVCGFITGSCYSLSFQIWPLKHLMTWKGNGLMGLFTLNSRTEIGKILSVTWTMGCDPTTALFIKNFPSLDWFGWVNVWCLHFRNFCYMVVRLEFDLVLGVGGEIGVWFSTWGYLVNFFKYNFLLSNLSWRFRIHVFVQLVE